MSRVPVDEALPKGNMTARARIANLPEGGPKLGMFQLWAEPGRDLNKTFEMLVPFFADRANFDERFLASYQALLAQGQISPLKVPPMKGDDED